MRKANNLTQQEKEERRKKKRQHSPTHGNRKGGKEIL
jgi:hypothetical protein